MTLLREVKIFVNSGMTLVPNVLLSGHSAVGQSLWVTSYQRPIIAANPVEVLQS